MITKKIVKISNLIGLVALLLLSYEIRAIEITAQEVVSKHLDSIASKDKRDTLKTRMAIGVSEFRSKLPSRQTTGKIAIVSENKEFLFLSSFRSNEYPYEKIGYFKESMTIPLALPNSRSPLGAFIADHSVTLTERLFTGIISMHWALLDSDNTKTKVKFNGTKKINGINTYILSYYPKTNSPNFSIRMYFDAASYHHIRTEYRDTIPPKENPFGILGDLSGLTIGMIEDFGDFKTTDGITLPHSYKISYLTDSPSGTYEWDWIFKIEQYRHNEQLKDDFFKF